MANEKRKIEIFEGGIVLCDNIECFLFEDGTSFTCDDCPVKELYFKISVALIRDGIKSVNKRKNQDDNV